MSISQIKVKPTNEKETADTTFTLRVPDENTMHKIKWQPKCFGSFKQCNICGTENKRSSAAHPCTMMTKRVILETVSSASLHWVSI